MKSLFLTARWLIVWCISLSSIIMLGLCAFSLYKGNTSNGFNRKFPPHITSPRHILDVKYNSYYFSGADSKHIYLGNSSSPSHLLKIGQNLQDTAHLKPDLPKIRLIPGFTRILINDTSVYVTEGHSPLIMKTELGVDSFRVIDTTTFFISAGLSGNSNLVLKTFNGTESVLTMTDSDTKTVKFLPLERQVDGIFCSDGQILHAGNSNKVVYLYRYRNQFLITDNTLTLLLKGKTIDTVGTARIRLAKTGNGQQKLSSPPLVVNKSGTADHQYIYINSGLKADNEDSNTFKKHSVIDCYDVNNGSYRFSFYLPDFKGYKMNSFLVCNNVLFALYGHYLITYGLTDDVASGK